MKRISFYFLISIICFSCTTSESVENLDNSSGFYALAVGNSWVYKNYVFNNTSETYEDVNIIDSVKIVATENIDGELYFKFRFLKTGNDHGLLHAQPNGEYFEYLREVDGDLISSKGNVKFTNSNPEERKLYENGAGIVYEKLNEGVFDINIEAGFFSCVKSERYSVDFNGDLHSARDSYYYADGYGLVYDTCSFLVREKPYLIRRLFSYNIK